MSAPFVAEIRIFGFNFAPHGWAFCQGQILSIQQNTALFSLLGTTYGGNGTNNFALPDLRSRVALHWGQGSGLSDYALGEVTGSETVALTTATMPQHTHPAGCFSGNGDSYTGGSAIPATDAGGNNVYTNATDSSMNASVMTTAGSGVPHNNLQAYLAVNYCIALLGIYPSRN